jgi:transcriptional regulator with XRE-family HTH domain
LSGVENNHRDPSLSTILAVSKALGVAPGELLGGSGDVTAAALEAARLFDAAPEEIQEGVLLILRAVSRRRR